MQDNKPYKKQKYIGPQEMEEEDIYESLMIPMSLVQNISNCIVLIDTGSWRGTGFLCHLPIENSISSFYGIMTNNHVLPESELEEGNSIHLISENCIFENKNSEIDIKIERNQYVFTSKELDATFISVSPSQFHTSFNWLEVSKNDCKKGQYVFIIQHPNGGPQKIAYGSIKEIDGSDIHHLVSTKPGSSGSPLLDSDGLVIGLNYAESKISSFNFATKTSDIINAIENDRIQKFSDSTPPEILSAIEKSKYALLNLQRQRESFESQQINVFYAYKWQINDGQSESRRIKMEKDRDQQEKVFKKAEDVYNSSIREIDILSERCKDLKRWELYKILMFEKANLMIKEAENRRKRDSDLYREIERAKKPKFFGGLDSYYRQQLEEMQRKTQNEVHNLEQCASNLRALISS